MPPAAPKFDPYLHDSQRWGVSLAQMSELIVACLDAAGAGSVAEIGAFAGDLTRVLVAWAAGADARVSAIDPAPQDGLVALDQEYPQLTLVRETSLKALPKIELPDAIVIDGDHNHFTVSEELRLIGDRAPGAELPLLLFHDVCWPHARRDDYFDAEEIPSGHRHTVAGDSGGIFPGDPGLRPDGLPVSQVRRQGGRREQWRADGGRGLHPWPRRVCGLLWCQPSSVSAWPGTSRSLGPTRWRGSSSRLIATRSLNGWSPTESTTSLAAMPAR